MRARMILPLALVLIFAAPGLCWATASLNDTLSFEAPGDAGMPAGWHGGPKETISRDSTTVHGGRFAARMQRGPTSPSEFSVLTRVVPVNFTGDTLELRGWLRMENVSDFSGLWMREDGLGGMVEFDNMQKRKLSGTIPWTEYRIALPLNRKARFVLFGALLSGEGTVHADDLQLLVDGKQPSEAPPLVRELTAVDTDREFVGNSRVAVTKLSDSQIENLVLLAKVWGFVKYHHPRVTSAKLNWDFELFRVLPTIVDAEKPSQAKSALAQWLAQVGEPEAPEHPATMPDSAQMLPRIDWIRDRSRLGKDLSERLQRIYARRSRDGEQHYAAPSNGNRNADFSNEAGYPNPPVPDAGYRLLALFRFWNIIEYWFPYRDLIAEPWDGVLREFIPRLVAASTEDQYRLTMMALIARVRDGHANLWSSLDVRPPRGGCQLPLVLRSVEGKFVVGAYADSKLGRASGLQIGDEIRSLDGAPVDSLALAWAPYYGASNEAVRTRDIALSLTNGECGPCRVGAARGGTPFEVTAIRDSTNAMNRQAGRTHDLPGEEFRLLDQDVAYLKLSSFAAAQVPKYLKAAADTRCLVIDIRNYPSEFSVFALGQHLVQRSVPFARFTYGDLANPGAFLWTPPISLEPEEPRYAGRIVILVDESSMSQAEYTALAFRAAPNALVVGSTTAGADGNVSRIPLPGGIHTMISGLGVFYPDKTPTQQVGIVPNFVVRPTIEGIRNGRDEVLEAALKLALGRDLVIRR